MEASKKSLIEELQAALVAEAGGKWGAVVQFFDTLNTVSELDEVAPVYTASEECKRTELDMVEWYRERLIKWDNPVLTPEFQEKFPLLSARLDAPWKVRVLLRVANFNDVDPMVVGQVYEDVIRRHEVLGEQLVVYKNYTTNQSYWRHEEPEHRVLQTTYYSQIQAWTWRRLVLPGCKSTGCSSEVGVFFDWREKTVLDRV